MILGVKLTNINHEIANYLYKVASKFIENRGYGAHHVEKAFMHI